jgi:hypothetical protein
MHWYFAGRARAIDPRSSHLVPFANLVRSVANLVPPAERSSFDFVESLPS